MVAVAAAKKAAKVAAGAVAAGRESRRAYQDRYDARAAERAAAREPGEPLLQPRDPSPGPRRRPAAPSRTRGRSGGRVARTELGLRKGLSGSLDVATSGPKYVRILKAEFLLCMVILALSPLADSTGREGVTDAFRRCAACMGLFFLLGLLAAGGPKSGKAAAGFGGLVTVALLVAQRNVLGTVASKITARWPGAAGASVGGAAGNAAGDIADLAQAQADAAADNDTGDTGAGGGGDMMNRVPDGGVDPTADWTRGPLPPPGL